MFNLITSPKRIDVEKISSPKLSIEDVVRELDLWCEVALKQFGKKYSHRVEVDPSIAGEILRNAERLILTHVRPLCIDEETITIYYRSKQTGSQINIIAVYGYRLMEHNSS